MTAPRDQRHDALARKHHVTDTGYEVDTGTPWIHCHCGAGFRGLTVPECYIAWAMHVGRDVVGAEEGPLTPGEAAALQAYESHIYRPLGASPDSIEAVPIMKLTEYEAGQAAAVFHDLNRREDPYALTRTIEHILKMRAGAGHEPSAAQVQAGLDVLLRSTAQDDDEARLDVIAMYRAMRAVDGGSGPGERELILRDLVAWQDGRVPRDVALKRLEAIIERARVALGRVPGTTEG